MATLAVPQVGVPIAWWLLAALVSYVAGLAIHRAFISPIAKIPGPKIAAITSWYEVYYGMFLTTSCVQDFCPSKLSCLQR